jgi:hypothetical protein
MPEVEATPLFETSPELRRYVGETKSYWQDLGRSELQRRPDADHYAAPPVPTRDEIRRAIQTLSNARFHSGWVEIGDIEEVMLVAESWGVDPSMLIDCARDAGYGSAALRERYAMVYLED